MRKFSSVLEAIRNILIKCSHVLQLTVLHFPCCTHTIQLDKDLELITQQELSLNC
jgi:hypothetical protein